MKNRSNRARRPRNLIGYKCLMKRFRVLITGSSGQLGSEVARLLADDYELIGLDLLPGPRTTVTGSVTERERLFELLRGVDAVIHTAALHARHRETHSASQFVDVNVQGTLNLLEAAAANGVRRVVYTSTTSLYGQAMQPQGGQAVWVDEVLTPRPRDIYDVTKIAAEGLCQISAQGGGPACISLRVSRFFPEPARETAVYRAYRGLDVRDAAAAHRLALKSELPGYEVFNIAAKSPFGRADLPELWRDAPAVFERYFSGVQAEFARRGWALPEQVDRVYVVEKAERLLGYRPRFNFAELLAAA